MIAKTSVYPRLLPDQVRWVQGILNEVACYSVVPGALIADVLDSLEVTEFAMKLEARLGIEVDFTLTQCPTVAQLARYLADQLPPESFLDTPAPVTRWRHHSGNHYVLLFVTNLGGESRNPSYVPTVVYFGETNGELWSGSMYDWYRRMELEGYVAMKDEPSPQEFNVTLSFSARESRYVLTGAQYSKPQSHTFPEFKFTGADLARRQEYVVAHNQMVTAVNSGFREVPGSDCPYIIATP